MYFNDTTNNMGLCQDIDFICHTDTSSYTLANKARNINAWYRKAVSWIREAHGDWQYDDSNLTTLPIYTITLVDGQQDYELPSTAQTIERVEVMDNEGDYYVVNPIDKREVIGESLTEFEEDEGLPRYYDLVGRSVLLYPKPGTSFITTTSGLKVYVSRDVEEFNSTTTTREPGFANNFHRILSLGASYDFEEDPTKKNYLISQINELKDEIKTFYSKRDTEMKNIINPHKNSYY
jgi:hypothetical protein